MKKAENDSEKTEENEDPKGTLRGDWSMSGTIQMEKMSLDLIRGHEKETFC